MPNITIPYNEKIEEAFINNNNFFQRIGMSKGHTGDTRRFKAGDLLVFDKDVCIEAYSTIASGNILFSIGAFSSVASSLPAGSQVGRFCSIATGLKVMGFRHPIDAVCQSSAVFNFNREFVAKYLSDKNSTSTDKVDPKPVPVPQKKKALIIGHDVWIGSDCIFSPGVKVGNGAVVASGSVVVKDIPPYAIAGGNPAKIIKYRFANEIYSQLEDSRWWELDLFHIFKSGLDFSDPKSFLEGMTKEGSRIEKSNYTILRSKDLIKCIHPNAITTHHGTVLRTVNDKFLHDPAIKRGDNLSNPREISSLGYKLVGSKNNKFLIINSNGEYLSARSNGSTSWVARADLWEEFFF